MAEFVYVNGLPVSVADGSAGLNRVDLNTWSRSSLLTYEGTDYRKLRRWSFETTPLTMADADSLTGWIEGRGNVWNFSRYDVINSTTRFTRFSAEEGLAVGTGCTHSSNVKWGTWAMQINTAGLVSATVPLALSSGGTPHWTVSVWKSDNGGTYDLASAVYDGATLRYYGGLLGSTVTTAFAWATFSTTSNMWLSVSLDGENRAGTTGTTQYSFLRVLPYAATTTMLAYLKSNGRAEPVFPFVELSGHIVGTVTNQFHTVKGFVEDVEVIQGTMNGTFQPLHILKVRFEER